MYFRVQRTMCHNCAYLYYVLYTLDNLICEINLDIAITIPASLGAMIQGKSHLCTVSHLSGLPAFKLKHPVGQHWFIFLM